MEKYPILGADGAELVREDLEAGWALAGTVDDKVRAMLSQLPIPGSSRMGFVVPAADGPLVRSNGASGTVSVAAFTAYRSPVSPETAQTVATAFYAGSTETVPTPLPSAGNHRWDLLYARITDADSDAETRQVGDPASSSIGSSVVNTRHKGVVTLAWVQGISQPQATNPYPLASFPTTPAPGASEAIIPLAYVHVEDDATPATVTYDIDRLANVAPVAVINPQTGAAAAQAAGLSYVGGTSDLMHMADVKGIATSSDTYRWPQTSGAHRTKAFLEPVAGDRRLWLSFDFYGSSFIGASWQILPVPLLTPDQTAPAGQYCPFDLKGRWFMGQLAMSESGLTFSRAQGFGTVAVFPTRMPHATPPPIFCPGLGNSVRANSDFETEAGLVAGDWYLACMFRDVLQSGASNDLALLVRRSASGGGFVQGAMYLAVREAVANVIDGRCGVIKVDVSPQFMPSAF